MIPKARTLATATAAALALTLPAVSLATVSDLPTGSFLVEKEVVVPGPPEAAFDAFTGDLLPWWDHHFSATPKALYIEPKPGGGFWEIFDDAGNGAKHADVIYADRGKTIRLRGPFGFSGHALDMVHDFTFTAEGDSTRVTLTLRAVGEFEEGWPAVVDSVWEHFLVERYKAWVEGRLPAASQ